MLHRTWFRFSAGALICLLGLPALRAELLRSLNFQRISDTGGPGESPVLLTFFATVAPSLGRPFPYHPCTFGPYLPAPGKPCFALLQENVTTN